MRIIDNYFDFKYSLQDLFGRNVDLVEEQSIKNLHKKSLFPEKC